MSDPHFANVSLLLPMFGADQGTVFTDYSPTPKTITRYGDARTVTAQSKYYGSSGYFDGSGDYLTVPASGFLSGSGDATVEAWVYPETTSGTRVICSQSSIGFNFELRNDTGLGLWLAGPDTYRYGGTVSNLAWSHIAFTKQGDTFRLFVNGVLVSTTTQAVSFSGTSCSVGSSPTATLPYKGYIEDLRITKGVARYTANFTPPTQLYVTYSVSGVISEAGTPVARTVYLLDRATGALLGSTTSDASTRAYSFSTFNQDEVLRIVKGSDAPLQNDRIDRVIPG